MSSGYRDRVDGFLAQLVGDLPHLLQLEPAQVPGSPNRVEKRRSTKYGHSDIPILQVGMRAQRERGYASMRRPKSRISVGSCAGRSLVGSLDTLRPVKCDTMSALAT